MHGCEHSKRLKILWLRSELTVLPNHGASEVEQPFLFGACCVSDASRCAACKPCVHRLAGADGHVSHWELARMTGKWACNWSAEEHAQCLQSAAFLVLQTRGSLA
jgi:hypothetical protein